MSDPLAEYTLTPYEASRLLGVGPRTLMRWRKVGFGPTAMRVGMRNHKYSRREIMRWLEEYNHWKVAR